MGLNRGSQLLVIIHEKAVLYKLVLNNSIILLYNILR